VNRADATSLLERLLRQIAPEVDLAAIDGDALLQDEAELDSVDFLELVTRIEQETGFGLPERDYPLLATSSGLVAYLVGQG
jgi:acyl carrier protein